MGMSKADREHIEANLLLEAPPLRLARLGESGIYVQQEGVDGTVYRVRVVEVESLRAPRAARPSKRPQGNRRGARRPGGGTLIGKLGPLEVVHYPTSPTTWAEAVEHFDKNIRGRGR